ncbi:MAG: DUF4129 domain-containing protein, partial [Acidobacteriota bacterium]|nr:DUF4129 domain-containing protein [Acidobacteriota bacterium]
YDFAHQVVLAQNLKNNSRNWSERAKSWFDTRQQRGRNWIKNWEFQHSKLRYWLPLALVLLVVLLRVDMIPVLIRRIRLNLQARVGRSGALNPELASKLYYELMRLLGKRGISRPEAQTPSEFAAAVNDARLAPAVREFTQIYGHARFGHVPCDADRLREILAQVRTTIRSH